MCWSENGSLATYLLAMILAATHKRLGTINPTIWIFMVAFTQVQLIEYFLWKNINNPEGNKFWSTIGLGAIVTQPLFIFMLLPDHLRNKAFMIYGTVLAAFFATKKIDLSTEVGGNGHLKWNWVNELYIPFSLGWILMMGAAWWTGHNFMVAAILLNYLMSSYFNQKYNTTGSYWCWSANFFWILAFFIKP